MKDLKFIFRMFKRNPLLVFVNLPGLAIGLSAVLLLSVYVKYELSYDKHFPTRDHVLRLYNSITENGQEVNYGICMRSAYTDIPQNIPEIEVSTQLYTSWGIAIEKENTKYSNLNLLYADRGFFDVFGLDLIYGNISDALGGDKKVVLNASTAQKIFNKLNCIGEIVYISEEPFTVSGIMADLPKNTHFQCDLLASMETLMHEEWNSLEFYTYFKINKNADKHKVSYKIAAANDELIKARFKGSDFTLKSGTELLADLHIHSVADYDLSPKANLFHIYLVASIAFFVLLIALVNYINLYVLHGEKRIAEIAARKSLGANTKSLLKLFFTETGIIALIALALALIISTAALPFFGRLMQRQMHISELLSASGLSLAFLILLIIVGISGAYPSYYLSRINLINALKGKSNQVRRKSTLSRFAVITQFTVTVFLISTLIVVYAQVDFLKNVPIGFNTDHLYKITNLDSKLKESYQSIESELSQLPFIESISTSNHSVGGGCSGQAIKLYGQKGKKQSINEYRVNPGFCKNLQLELKGGRYFTTTGADKNAVILNEAAVKLLGIKNAVGSKVIIDKNPLTVIAVVKNFYYTSNSGEAIAPLVISQQPNNYLRNFYVRTRSDITTWQSAQIESVFKSYSPNYIMARSSVADSYQKKYEKENRVVKLLSSGSILAIMLSLIGLTALSVLNVNRRRKEIGIRKVIGSTEKEIVKSLLSETFILVLISMAIAFICSYSVLHAWLINFAKHINLSPLYFIISGAIAFILAFVSVSYQSWRAATRNPVEALKYE
jgi:putative ABC transport system permease protein